MKTDSGLRWPPCDHGAKALDSVYRRIPLRTLSLSNPSGWSSDLHHIVFPEALQPRELAPGGNTGSLSDAPPPDSAETPLGPGPSHSLILHAGLVQVYLVGRAGSSQNSGRSWRMAPMRDVLFGLRVLRRDAAFTVFAVLTLALGIGASTSVFSVLNALVLRDLPVRDPSRLVIIYRVNRSGQHRFRLPSRRRHATAG